MWSCWVPSGTTHLFLAWLFCCCSARACQAMADLKCSGSEWSVEECTWSSPDVPCMGHAYDTVVYCTASETGGASQGAVRLIAGRSLVSPSLILSTIVSWILYCCALRLASCTCTVPSTFYLGPCTFNIAPSTFVLVPLPRLVCLQMMGPHPFPAVEDQKSSRRARGCQSATAA